MAINQYYQVPKLEEYSEKFKDFFKFKRENGILEVKMHTKNGPVKWSYQFHHALAELWTVIGHDKENEVLILTSTDDKWINEWDTESFAEVEQSPDEDQRYNVQIYDTLKIVENFINDIEIPTIAAINGKGIHWEMCMMSDITLCTPDFVLQDDHFGMDSGHVPGDGMGLCLQEILGVKRGNYMMLTCEAMDAQTCLELGAVNEVVEREDIVERAWEIAKGIMKKSRSCRRLTHYICVRPWKAVVERDFRIHVLSEMYSFNMSDSAHDFEYIKYDDK
ncbi:enoyl-CoA hydratase/isomerase family protein [Paraglaciecola sp. Hal342]|jgi:enoyl-CoA hydratase/carnithine racemase|uniref:Enoyl-CoA hydratase/isomerase family protein n=1 Tax=Paraglaciecola chathamensis TaxID=368405 RepID=A0ABS0W8D5_9ALTE|nr:enoyl-CoA hydratase/isomerase family protein [Paraglaciecola chathamensis]MBJ2135040.1 enoyl-CoA hydratase/isomerase family protein [Paraglaciecola chathamensis]